jgi:hypothetical protein
VPVRRIDDEPRGAALGDPVLIAKLRRAADLALGIAAEKRRALDRVLLPVGQNLLQLAGRNLIERLAASCAGRSKGVPCSYLFV